MFMFTFLLRKGYNKVLFAQNKVFFVRHKKNIIYMYKHKRYKMCLLSRLRFVYDFIYVF